MHTTTTTVPRFLKLLLLQVVIGCLASTATGAADDRPPAAITWVIRGATVFDSEHGRLLAGQEIVIAGERILFAGPAAESPEIPREVPVIDARGKYVIPGLIDGHVHLVAGLSTYSAYVAGDPGLSSAHVTGDEVLPLFLAAGVTAVRSTGEEIVAATVVAHFAASHPDRAPRVFTCSPLIDGDPPIHSYITRSLTEPAQVPAFVDDMVQWKVTTLKIYAACSRPVGKAVIEEAHRRGLVVTAHLGHAYRAQDAVADGVDCLEHLRSVFDYIVSAEAPGPVVAMSGVANQVALFEEARRQAGQRAHADLTNPLATELIAMIVSHGVMVDPTLVIYRNLLSPVLDPKELSDNPDNALVPRRLRDLWLRSTPSPWATLDLRRAEFAKYQELTGVMYRAGVPILAGTDTPLPNVPPGFSLHQELELLVESGLSPAAALQAATWNNARALRQERELGSIASGKLADLVVLDKNPLDDIHNTRSIHTVFRGGQPVNPSALLKLVPTE